MRQFVVLVSLVSNILNRYSYAKCGDIFLTVNAVTNYLEYNWDFTVNCEEPPDSLTIIYSENDHSLETIDLNGALEGYRLSNVKFGRPVYPGNWNNDGENPILASACYPYLIQSRRYGELIDSNCIKIEPSWMRDFGKLKIGDMMIPGTHDSGSWMSPTTPLLTKFVLAQEYDLWGQLVSGIRYFDIRVGLYGDELWINHGIFQCSKMKDEFQKVAKFLTLSPNEIVILHMKRFEVPKDFTEMDHSKVLNLLEEVLSEHILPRSNFENVYYLTLEEIWKYNKSLIVSYSNADIINENKWLWSDILHKWGNKIDVSDLYYYLDSVKSNHDHPPTPFCALMAELTPNGEYILKNLDKSLRHLADFVNPKLNVWLRKYNWSDVVNIVATDFFLGNNVVSIAIEANNRRLLNMEDVNDHMR